MRFTNFIYALPIIGSALAAPIVKQDSVALAARDVDVVQVVTQLKSTVATAVNGIGAVTVVTEVESRITTIITALDSAYAALGVQVDASVGVQAGAIGLKRQLPILGDAASGAKQEVASLLTDIIVLVNSLANEIGDDIKSLPLIAGLLAKLTPALNTLLLGVNLVLNGVLQLVGTLLAGLGLNLNGLLAPVIGLLNPLVGGLLGGHLG